MPARRQLNKRLAHLEHKLARHEDLFRQLNNDICDAMDNVDKLADTAGVIVLWGRGTADEFCA